MTALRPHGQGLFPTQLLIGIVLGAAALVVVLVVAAVWLVRIGFAWILAAVAVLLVLAVGFAAFAHGPAQWIQDNPLYVDIDGTHCCGPADCRPDHEAKFRETDQGVEIATGAGDWTLFPKSRRARGLYASIDDRWWICVRDGKVRCVFKPTTGS